FANIKDSGEVVLSDEWADRQIKYDGDQEHDGAMFGNLNQFLQLKKQHRHLKTLLSIGGWSYSGSFCGMNDAAKRQTF
ncbi:UNVERIFIED_CONTAM: glycosyl hydrolase family 18 protein, partial [Escherichia coli]